MTTDLNGSVAVELDVRMTSAGGTRGLGLSLLPPGSGLGRDLFHPLRNLAFVDVVHGFELHATRRLAHTHRRHRRYRLERRAVDEHELDVAGEAPATEAPAVADAVVRH